ncbi:MAG TPA: SRPBCC family protein [Chitinophagaceae bacterium]|nr:SRPBCC family protein [Chitinophagaceae bacterium]
MVFIYILPGLILLSLIAALLLPKNYNIEKSTIIKKNISETMDKVGDLNFYSLWNPWQQSDPTAKGTVTGIPKTAGHKYAWTGKKVGIGALTLSGIDDKHIHFDLEFFKPWKSKAKDNWLFEPWADGNETKVTWQNSGALPFPVARLMGPMISKQLNRQFVTGLLNLKKMCED